MTRCLLVILAAAALVAGCSDKDSALPEFDFGTEASGTIAAGGEDFAITVTKVRTADGFADGPIVLRGADLRYSDADGTLLVDLTLTNASDAVLPEPVTLAFTTLLPAGVALWNAPGGGMSYPVGFANDDGVWTPGETSLPLTVAFLVAEGVSVGFSARVELGSGAGDGAISGRVFEDLNGNGVPDAGESGVPGAVVSMGHDVQEIIGRTLTDAVGNFAFEGLGGGPYTVMLPPQPLLAPTGDPVLHVLLVDGPDGVSSFDEAWFGVLYAPVDSVDLSVPADATVRADVAGRKNDNYGADPFLAVGTGREPAGTPDRIRGYMRFPTPADSSFGAAYLELTIAAFRDGAGQVYELVLNPVVPTPGRTPWPEGNGSEVTPAPLGVAWVDAADGIAWVGAGDGGDANNRTQPAFAPDPVASLTLVQSAHAPGDVIRFEITDLVRAWQDGTIPNEGVVLRDVGTTGGFRQLWFGARDGLERGYTDPRVQPGPRLVIE